MLLDTPTSLTSAVGALCDLHHDYVIQSFITEASGVDIRVLVVGGEAIAAMKRRAPAGEFRANIHKGASGASRHAAQRIYPSRYKSGSGT